jgi:hypothetical protein
VNNKKWLKWCKFVSDFFLITLMAYLCSQRTQNIQIKYFMFDWSIYRLFVLNTGWNVNLSKWWYSIMLVRHEHGWTKNAFWNVINKKWRNGCKLVSPFLSNNTYGLPVLTKDTKCPSHFLFYWSIYILIVLNTGWKRDSLQIIIIVYICFTWRMFETKGVLRRE